MARARERLFTIEDWLAYEGEPDTRYELIDGRLVAMSPPKTWHGAIANQIGRVCADALEGRFPCRAIQSPGLEIRREPRAKGYIPDIVVTCEPIDQNHPTVAEPRLVIEVLSTSTASYDKADKLDDYKGVDSVEEIWLVSSHAKLLLQVVRDDQRGWCEPKAFIGRARFYSPVLEATVALSDIYRFTPMGQATAELPDNLDPP